MADYSRMTTEDFDAALLAVLENETAKELLSIPGVYEIVAEFYNNAALDSWADAHPQLAYPEDYDEN
mgnify:CR=1 FL=1